MKTLRPSHIAKLFNAQYSNYWNLEAYGDHPPLQGYIHPESPIFKDDVSRANFTKNKYRKPEFNRRIL